MRRFMIYNEPKGFISIAQVHNEREYYALPILDTVILETC